MRTDQSLQLKAKIGPESPHVGSVPTGWASVNDTPNEIAPTNETTMLIRVRM
jgi:hypothetical protein